MADAKQPADSRHDPLAFAAEMIERAEREAAEGEADAPEVAEQVEAARRYKYVSTVEISLPPHETQDHYGFRDFSSEGIERRRVAGRTRALEALRSIFAPML